MHSRKKRQTRLRNDLLKIHLAGILGCKGADFQLEGHQGLSCTCNDTVDTSNEVCSAFPAH